MEELPQFLLRYLNNHLKTLKTSALYFQSECAKLYFPALVTFFSWTKQPSVVKFMFPGGYSEPNSVTLPSLLSTICNPFTVLTASLISLSLPSLSTYLSVEIKTNASVQQ